MSRQIPPKCEFSAEITLEQYIQGSLYHARWAGQLRNTLGVLTVGALLFTGGLVVLLQYIQKSYANSLLLLAVVMGLSGIALPLIYLLYHLAAVKKQAAANYPAFEKMMKPMTVRLYEDKADTVSGYLMLYDQYALMAKCVETKEFFLLIKDRDRFLLIPKDNLPNQKRGEVEEFLRLVFAGRYRKMNNIIL